MKSATCCFLAMACLAQAQTEIQIPPFTTSVTVENQPLQITISGTASAINSGVTALALTIDLGDLQEHLTPVLSAGINRNDRCGERLSVERVSLAPDAPASVLTANINYERYACVKALGKQIVKKLVGGHGVIEVSLTPSVADNNISLDAQVRKVDADGTLGEVLRSGDVGDSIREEIADSIESAIQKVTDLKATLPAAIENAAVIKSIQFADGGGGRLWLKLAGEVRLSSEQMRRAVGQ